MLIADRVSENHVSALTLLSSSLRAELRFQICQAILRTHALFSFCVEMDEFVVKRICVEGIEVNFLRPKDDLFVAGDESEHAYFLSDGTVDYSQTPDTSPVLEETVVNVAAVRCLAEAALWSQWIHVGTCMGVTLCQLLLLQALVLAQVVVKNRMIGEIVQEYGRHFHRRLASAVPPNSAWPNDLKVPFTDYEDLVMLMDNRVKAVIGLSALETL